MGQGMSPSIPTSSNTRLNFKFRFVLLCMDSLREPRLTARNLLFEWIRQEWASNSKTVISGPSLSIDLPVRGYLLF